MVLYKELYVSDELKKKEKKVLHKIRNGQMQLNIYVITLSQSESNQLDIFNVALLVQKKISIEHTFIVGISKGYEAALVLVEKIVQDIYHETQDVNIRAYLLNRQKQLEESEM